jgi:hypothetical protein
VEYARPLAGLSFATKASVEPPIEAWNGGPAVGKLAESVFPVT